MIGGIISFNCEVRCIFAAAALGASEKFSVENLRLWLLLVRESVLLLFMSVLMLCWLSVELEWWVRWEVGVVPRALFGGVVLVCGVTWGMTLVVCGFVCRGVVLVFCGEGA